MHTTERPAEPDSSDASQMQAGVQDLEKSAFERGLPETNLAPYGPQYGDRMPHGARNMKSSMHATQHAPRAGHKAPIILLIDDEESFRAVLKQVLVHAGYEVVEASNGAEGIQYFYEKPTDMIVTDIIMPGKEGIETMIELKQAYPQVKLIAMSGGGWYGTDIDFDMAKRLGARTLDKPFPLQELLDAVSELLN